MARRSPPARDLDLVPIMNLVTILIPFLLLSASFVSLAAIDSILPSLGPTSAPSSGLELSIAVSRGGYALAAAQPLPLPEGTRLTRDPTATGPQAWPTDQLKAALARIKERYPDEDTVILEPEADTSYELIVYTMDAARGDRRDLFPGVVIAGGQ